MEVVVEVEVSFLVSFAVVSGSFSVVSAESEEFESPSSLF